MSSRQETFVPDSGASDFMVDRPQEPHELLLERELKALDSKTIPFDLAGIDSLFNSPSHERVREMVGTAVALRVNDLYFALHRESVTVLNSDNGEVGVAFPNVNVHLDSGARMDKKGVDLRAQQTINSASALVEYEKLLGLVQAGRVTEQQLHDSYAGMSRTNLEEKVNSLRESLNRTAGKLHDGLIGRQVTISRTELQPNKPVNINARPGAVVIAENDHVWVMPASEMPRYGMDRTIASDERQAKRQRQIKRAGVVGTMLLTAACGTVSPATPTEAPVNPENMPTEPPATTEPEAPAAATYEPQLPTSTQTSEAPTPNAPGQAGESPVFEAAGGPIVGLTEEQREDLHYWAVLQEYKRANGTEGQPVLFANREEYHAAMDAFLAEEGLSVMQHQDSETQQVLTAVVRDNKDGTYDVSYAFTQGGALASTDPMAYGMDNVKRGWVRVNGVPRFTQGENGVWYLGVEQDGEVAQWFNPNGANLDNLEEQWVDMEKDPISCVDPELIAQQDADFMSRTGIDLNNLEASPAGQKFAEGLTNNQYIAFTSDKEGVGFSLIKTGMGIVDLDAAPDSGIDKLVCMYGRSGVMPDKTMVVVVGWIDAQGNFQHLANGVDSVNRKNLDPSEQLAFFQKLPDGAVVSWDLHLFRGLASPDQIRPGNIKRFPDQHEFVKKLLLAMNNQLVERVSGVAGFEEYLALMDPELGDHGFIPSGEFEYVDNVKLK